MGYAAGTPGQTGVGSSQNATGQSQQPGFGGKGGGAGTPPQTISQPGQSSSAPENKPAPVFGGNAFGYNMNRLAGRMDPSASLPPQQTQAPVQQAPAAQGGKGGGYGDLSQFPGAQEFLSQYGQQDQQQQPMYGQQPQYDQQDQQQQPMYGQQQQQQPMYGQQAEQENPFAAKQSDYENQLADLKAQIASIKSGQFDTIEDTGAKVHDFGEGYDPDKFKTQTEAEEETKVATDKVATDKATEDAIPDYYTNKAYKYDTYADFADEDIAGLSTKDLKSLYSAKLTTAKADAAQAKKDYDAALKSGDPKRTQAALKNYNDQLAETKAVEANRKNRETAATTAANAAKKSAADKLAADKAAAAKVKTDAAAKAKADAKAVADKKKADAKAKADAKKAEAAAKAAAKKAEADAKKAAKKTTTKKATGGIIHNGMSNNLKKMLGE